MTDKILLAHGSGGKLSHDLISRSLLPALKNSILEKLDDSAVFEDQYLIRVDDAGYPVGDNERGTAFHKPIESRFYFLFGF